MSIWVLVIVLFMKDGSGVVSQAYQDRFTCETKMGAVATIAQADKNVTGWVIMSPCTEVAAANKI